jgi:hypothetical protein
MDFSSIPNAQHFLSTSRDFVMQEKRFGTPKSVIEQTIFSAAFNDLLNANYTYGQSFTLANQAVQMVFRGLPRQDRGDVQ